VSVSPFSNIVPFSLLPLLPTSIDKVVVASSAFSGLDRRCCVRDNNDNDLPKVNGDNGTAGFVSLNVSGGTNTDLLVPTKAEEMPTQ
jgi:hypothetical protein